MGIHLHFGYYQYTDPQPGTYQLSYPIGKSYTRLNNNNGYRGGIDSWSLFQQNIMNRVIRIKDSEDQYIVIDNKFTYKIPDIETWLLYRDMRMIADRGPDVVSVDEFNSFGYRDILPSKKLMDVLEPVVADIFLAE